MSDFLSKLGDQISNQFSIGENTNHSLDSVIDGKKEQYGSLGDFAKQVDKSSERRYVEEGYLKNSLSQSSPKQFEILMQEPNASIFIKKRMFASVNENFRPDYMDEDEKIYYKTMQVLFENKCRQISSLEKLSKIQKITSQVGSVSEQLLPIITGLIDQIYEVTNSDSFQGFSSYKGNKEVKDFYKVIDRVRKITSFNIQNKTTTWVSDANNLFQSKLGTGTGVIEITNFTNVNTTVGLSLGSGNCSLTISDPYESMLITEFDIERALSDATNKAYNSKTFRFSKESIESVINSCTTKLNSFRNKRSVSLISFKINPETFLGRRVIAIIDSSGVELPFDYDIFGGVKVSKDYLINGVLDKNGLNTEQYNFLNSESNVKAAFPDSELSIFKRLVSAIFSKITLEANSIRGFVEKNELANYARKKLRFNFLGKLLIQPMDTIHVYINSKSRYDNKLLSGLPAMFSGSTFLQNANHTVINLKDQISILQSPGSNPGFQAEKAAFVGSDFPNFLWSLLRNQFVIEKEGVHVFAGVVSSAVDNWSSGAFTVNVNALDNSSYLEKTKVNFKPSADVFNGSFYDPLTPFKTTFDSVGSKDKPLELLNENKMLLGNSQDKKSSLVKFKLGPNAGENVTEDNFFQDISIEKSSRSLSKVYYAPDGLVYKWKEGIGVLTQFGSSNEINDPFKVGNSSLTEKPFAGQDVMNVISLCITGQPYNFATYWNTVINFDGAGRDPYNKKDSSHSYYESLKNDLSKNNATWGNFIPFKNISIDEQSYKEMKRSYFTVTSNNKDIDSKIQEIANLQNDLNAFSMSGLPEDLSYGQQQVTEKISLLKKDVEDLQIQNTLSSQNLIDIGGDITYDINSFNTEGGTNKSLSEPAIRRNLQRQINYLTRRMSYNVKANEDKNLFIVDDFYDKDYDIAAYEKTLAQGVGLYNNAFTSVKENIVLASDLLNLEVFADTQGHLRARPPQYNRIPSSVFYKMMALKKSTGIEIYPSFLNDLFGNQIKTISEKIEVIEDQIRLYCAVLGVATNNDSDIDADKNYIEYLSNVNDTRTNPTAEAFQFVTSEQGQLSDLNEVAKASFANDSESNSTFETLKSQAQRTKGVFTTNNRVSAILKTLSNEKLSTQGYGITNIGAFSQNTRVDKIIDRLQFKTNQKINKNDFILIQNRMNNSFSNSTKTIDSLKINNDLSSKIKERQINLKLLYGLVKNSIEAKALDNDNFNSNILLTPGTHGNSNIPEIFEHMIEDEGYDDLGPGSGSRYIIKRSQIRNLSIQESPPQFTEVTVTGILGDYIENNSLPSELNNINNGNSLVSASAIDYDLWRNYGSTSVQSIQVPFLNNPETQCAPYATMILSRARKDILKGRVNISGNEFAQPGEVVYLEDRGMLFYVSSVSHSFSFGGQFETSLELTYGHSPGEYIPTTLDVIGKLLYKNKNNADVIVQRQSSSFNQKNMGVFIKATSSNDVISIGQNSINPLSSANAQMISNILYDAAYIINSNDSKGNNVKASIELRIYSNANEKSSSIDFNLSEFASNIKKLLTDKDANSIIKQHYKSGNNKQQNPALKPSDVKIIEIKMNDANETSSPSQLAHDAARNYTSLIGNNNSGDIKSTSIIKNILQRYIVDCWIKFEQVPTEVANSKEV